MTRYDKIFLLALCPLSILFFVGGPDAYSLRSLREFWNLGHLLFFALFSYLLFRCFFANAHRYKKIALVLFSAAVIGFTIEIFQYGIGRRVDMNDVWRDILGAMIGLMFVPLGVDGTKKWLVRSVVILLTTHQLVPFVVALVDESRAREDFPLLSGFESVFELGRWRGKGMAINKVQARGGENSLQVQFNTDRYSGISLDYFPANWVGYRTLRFDAYSYVEELSITVRIHDLQHIRAEQLFSDRFNRRISLRKGWNTVSVDLREVEIAPKTRRIDLSEIISVGIFVSGQESPKKILIDSVKLY